MSIKKDYLVHKSSVLNQMRAGNLTLQEQRLLAIYLSRINPNDIESKQVQFTLNEFNKVMDITKGQNFKYYYDLCNNLASKTVALNEGTSWSFIAIFLRVKFDLEEGVFSVEAHPDILHHMFDLREKFIKYKLWNALALGSTNQLRMYELLKQFEGIGYRIISIDEIKEYLGIEQTQYPLYSVFKRDVLDVCQKALAEKTDIKYTYETIKKGRKVDKIKFYIVKNKGYNKQLRIEDFLENDEVAATVEDEEEVDELELDEIIRAKYSTEHFKDFGSFSNGDFTEEQLEQLWLMMTNITNGGRNGMNRLNFWIHCYRKLEVERAKGKIKEAFPHYKYFTQIVLGESKTWDNDTSTPQHITLKNQNQLAEKENELDNLAYQSLKNIVYKNQ